MTGPLAVVAAALVWADGSLPAPGGALESGVAAVPIAGRTLRLRIDALDLPASTAARADLPAGAAGLGGDAYGVTSELVVRAPEPGGLLVVAAEEGWSVESFDVAPHYYRVETGSVRAMLRAADRLTEVAGVTSAEAAIERPKAWRALPDDPLLPDQWHLHNTTRPLADVNAEGAWSLGYTGAGVLIGIADSGVQWQHLDLEANYNAPASQTFAAGPTVQHGTSVAGVAVAVGDNGRQVAGMAYNAQFSELRVGTDIEDAEALAHRNDLHDIKNNSWGPSDNGQAHVLPNFVTDAVETAVRTGRGGLGTVMVWAAGNGRLQGDRVDYDPLASSRYTIAVGAIGDRNTLASYSEPGAALLLVAHSDGNVRSITTTAFNNGTTGSFGGTSSAAPLAAGVAAVVLEANPSLTWRDVQRVLVDSARQIDAGNAGWTTNGAGYAIHEEYGYGAIDAGAAVALAQDWQNLPHEISIDTGIVAVEQELPDAKRLGIEFEVPIDRDIRIESAELFIDASHESVGQLVVVLDSPAGTRSFLADTRNDFSDDYVDYRFTSMRMIGERSAGVWRVRVGDGVAGTLGTWHGFRLVLHGTPLCPGEASENGVFDLDDLLIALGAYGRCEGVDPGFVPELDVDNSGCNDMEDLINVLTRFGEVCE